VGRGARQEGEDLALAAAEVLVGVEVEGAQRGDVTSPC
jgi:hypothetical protein